MRFIRSRHLSKHLIFYPVVLFAWTVLYHHYVITAPRCSVALERAQSAIEVLRKQSFEANVQNFNQRYNPNPIDAMQRFHPQMLQEIARLPLPIRNLPSLSNDVTATGNYLQVWPWHLSTTSYCDGKVVVYQNDFARLRDVVVRLHLAEGPDGGEEAQTVLGRAEAGEFFRLHSGFFSLQCTELRPLERIFRGNNHLNDYASALYMGPIEVSHGFKQHQPHTVFAITRYEYVNFCHSMGYFFNAYLMMRYFNLQPENVHILIVDAHAADRNFDTVWNTLFANLTRVGQLRKEEESVLYPDLVWVPLGYSSPVLQDKQSSVPLLDDFRSFFLQRHQVVDNSRLDCSRLRVTIIWRRNYVAHPRNPSGTVSRKITNEQELMDALSSKFGRQANFTGVDLSNLNVTQQLHVVVNTDILIGMHGAGLMHALFLPQHAALIELFPTYHNGNARFRKLAQWRQLRYASWMNTYKHLEIARESTQVPPNVIEPLVRQMIQQSGCAVLP